jgi:hypothetical protein
MAFVRDCRGCTTLSKKGSSSPCLEHLRHVCCSRTTLVPPKTSIDLNRCEDALANSKQLATGESQTMLAMARGSADYLPLPYRPQCPLSISRFSSRLEQPASQLRPGSLALAGTSSRQMPEARGCPTPQACFPE